LPEYSKTDITDPINLQDVLTLIEGSKHYRSKCLFSILYMVPVRPAELLELKRKDFSLHTIPDTETPDYLEFTIVTKKLGKKKFYPKRVFKIYSANVPHVMFHSIWRYINSLLDPERRLFNMSSRNMRYLVDKAGFKILRRHLCPYAFRHQTLTRYAREGKGIEDLMYLKGSADVRSISPYLHGKKQDIKIKEI